MTDSQASAGYIGVHHAITPKLKGSLTAMYQYSEYRYAGQDISDNEGYFGIGVGLHRSLAMQFGGIGFGAQARFPIW